MTFPPALLSIGLVVVGIYILMNASMDIYSYATSDGSVFSEDYIRNLIKDTLTTFKTNTLTAAEANSLISQVEANLRTMIDRKTTTDEVKQLIGSIEQRIVNMNPVTPDEVRKIVDEKVNTSVSLKTMTPDEISSTIASKIQSMGGVTKSDVEALLSKEAANLRALIVNSSGKTSDQELLDMIQKRIITVKQILLSANIVDEAYIQDSMSAMKNDIALFITKTDRRLAESAAQLAQTITDLNNVGYMKEPQVQDKIYSILEDQLNKGVFLRADNVRGMAHEVATGVANDRLNAHIGSLPYTADNDNMYVKRNLKAKLHIDGTEPWGPHGLPSTLLGYFSGRTVIGNANSNNAMSEVHDNGSWIKNLIHAINPFVAHRGIQTTDLNATNHVWTRSLDSGFGTGNDNTLRIGKNTRRLILGRQRHDDPHIEPRIASLNGGVIMGNDLVLPAGIKFCMGNNCINELDFAHILDKAVWTGRTQTTAEINNSAKLNTGTDLKAPLLTV